MSEQFSISKLRNRQQIGSIDQSLPTVMPKSLRHTSQVSDLLHVSTDPTRHTNMQTIHFHNPITQQSSFFQVMKSKDSESFSYRKQNNLFHQQQNQLSLNKKFSKPYSDCTKYVDNLSQHKALIRRGPFDIPAFKKGDFEGISDVRNLRSETENSSKQYTLSNNLSRLKSASCSANDASQFQYRSVFRTKKGMIFQSLNKLKLQVENKPIASKSINHFDRSLKNTTSNYEILMRQERSLKSDNVVLKNSINKLAAVDIIKQKLEEGSLLTKNNLRKIQQKFKKKHEIKLQNEN